MGDIFPGNSIHKFWAIIFNTQNFGVSKQLFRPVFCQFTSSFLVTQEASKQIKLFRKLRGGVMIKKRDFFPNSTDGQA